jgi:NTE family protein/lysophospholipid hydrolase
VTNSVSIFSELDRPEIAKLIAPVAVFAGLDAEVLAEIAAIATPLELATNVSLLRQGDPGDALYVIRSGEFDVVLELDGGRHQTLARRGAGDCVGEMALLSQRTRSATVIAREPAQVLRIAADAFESVLARHPSVRAHLIALAARRLPSLHLAATGLFVGMDSVVLERFDQETNWVRLRGGETLVRQGERADEMFVVVHGSLEVVVEDREGRARLVDVLGSGSSVGEMALLSDEPRSATVRAIRDSELVRISKDDFVRLLDEHPRTAVELSRTLVRRLRQTTSAPRVTRFARTVALVPAQRAGMPGDFAPQLAASLCSSGDTVLRLSSATVDAELGTSASQTPFDDVANGRLLNWLNEREERFRYVVYECDPALTPWTQRCLRQADLVLAIALASDDPAPGDVERALLQPAGAGPGASSPRYELVLLHAPGTTHPSGTARWLHARAAGTLTAHHHVRLYRPADIARLARSIAGASLGLALSGGGARGFAQLGVMRALSEFGLEVDVAGGTSMGAIMAGLLAMGHDLETMIEMSRKVFVGYEVVGDLTAPVISLMRGASSVKLLQALFGDVQIEDLWIPYFCVSSNLSRAEVVVHDTGPLWLWTRASSSVPGIAPPVPYRGDLLVDGGVLNNLPADIMRERCRGSVVAVDVSATVELRTTLDHAAELSGWPHLARALNPFDTRAPFPNILRILSRTATLSSVHDQGAMKDVADLYLHPPTDSVDPLNWKAIDDVVDIGYRHAHGRIAEWKDSEDRITGVRTAIRRSSILAEMSRR